MRGTARGPMALLKLRRIRLGDEGAAGQLADLRAQLGAQGNVVSARGRELTVKVFGEPLPPARVVERVCSEVQQQGLPAVLRYTELLDRAKLTRDTLRVGARELSEAHAAAE